MTTNINSYILGNSTVQNTNLHNNVFGNVSGTAVEGDTTFQINATGDLTGGGTITLGNGGILELNYVAPTNVSAFLNDSNYISNNDNISLLTNNANYVSSGANISEFNNDLSYIVSGSNVSLLANDVGYLTSYTETDPIYTSSSWYSTTNNASSWDTAHSWGDHSLVGYLTSISQFDTDDVSEGSGNLYYTTARVRSSISVSGDLSYNSTTGVISYTSPTIPTTVSSFTNDAGYLTSYTDTNDNDYADSLSFEVSTGVLTVGRTGTLNDLTVDLDGRYQLDGSFAETDTLDSVTSRGNTTSNNITVNDLLVSGDLTVSGTTTTVFSEATRINENILYLNEGGESTITNAVGNGTTVTFTANNTYSVGYTVDITGVTPSSFNLVDASVTSADATTFTVTSTVTDTYVSGGEVYGHAHVNADLGWVGAYDDGTYAHAGFFRDATDGRFKVFDSYTVEPSASVDIDTSHASFNLADIQATTFHGSLSGNATTASAWANSRTISLNGDLSGSVSIDGSSNVTLTATVGSNAVALGTNTTGNYVSSVAAGSGISVAHSPSEGSEAIISHADTSSQSSVNNSGRTYIQDITLDGFGHITGITSGTETVVNTDTNDYVDSLSFGLTSGVLTLGRTGTLSDLTVDLDGRYSQTDTNYYVSNLAFNSTNGILTATRSGVADLTVDLDGRYLTGIVNNSVTLGTHTVGNYTATVGTSGNGIGITGTSGEGATYTITSNAVSTNSANTIVYRDGNGDFSAGVITATATKAQYADLAEKYTTDYEHSVGTVMMVSLDGEHETCEAIYGSIPVGVISEKPAILMNEDCDGQALALKGRVPVRVIGPIAKGQAIYVYRDGIASNKYNGAHLVGVALETNTDINEKLVECVLKI